MEHALNNETTRDRGVRRIFRKLLLTVTCYLPLIPSKGVRPWLCRLAGVNIIEPRSVLIGDGVRFDEISPNLISIGRNVRITSGTVILTHFLDTKYIPTPDKPFQFLNGEVRICDNVFIGVNTVIARPVTIGEGAVVGASSVVTKDIPPNAIVVGSPARVIGERPAMKRVD